MTKYRGLGESLRINFAVALFMATGSLTFGLLGVLYRSPNVWIVAFNIVTAVYWTIDLTVVSCRQSERRRAEQERRTR